MKLFLNIENQWVEPDYDVSTEKQISLTWTFENLSNPTKYVSEYSYEFELPITEKNDELFKDFRFLDEVGSMVHNKVIPYILQINSDVISTGECVLKEVNNNNYVVELNGALCTVFRKLLNSGWKQNQEETYYKFDDIENEYLDRTLVQRSWANDNPPFALTNYQMEDITNIFTFIPMFQGRYNDFENDRWIIYKNGLKETELGQQTDIEDDYKPIAKLDDGANEWQMQEFRSYEQPIGVYVQKLFEIYRRECKKITDYELVLDDRWYNNTYEYLQKLVFTLGKLEKEEQDAANTYELEISTERGATLPPNSAYNARKNEVNGLENIHLVATEPTFIELMQGYEYTIEYNANIEYTLPTSQISIIPNTKSAVLCTAELVNSRGQIITTHTTINFFVDDVRNSNGDYLTDGVAESDIAWANNIADDVVVTRIPQIQNGILKCTAINQFRYRSNVNENVRLRVTMSYANKITPFATYILNYNSCYPIQQANVNFFFSSYYQGVENQRSGRIFNFEKAFNEIKPFDILLKYSKLIGLFWVVDDFNKQIIVKRKSDYFNDLITKDNDGKNPHNIPYQGFFDITDKVKNDVVIEPMAWDSRYVAMNYAETDDSYASAYMKKYGVTYGTATVSTENYTNTATKNLLDDDKIKPSLVVQPYYQPMGYVTMDKNDAVQVDIAAPSSNEDDEYVDCDGAFYFRLANTHLSESMHISNWKTDSNGVWAIISDDSEYEWINNKFMWHSPTYTASQVIGLANETDAVVRSMPKFHAIRNSYCIQMADTYEVYYNVPPILRLFRRGFPMVDDSIQVKYVFDLEWKDYIAEIYDVNNKTISVKVAMDGELFRRLKYVPLVKIGNVGYLVVNVKEFNENNDFTAVTLREITYYNRLKRGSKTTPQQQTNNTIDGSPKEIINQSQIQVIKESDVDNRYKPWHLYITIEDTSPIL